MTFDDLQDYISFLKKNNDLISVEEVVDPYLELTYIMDREEYSGRNKAILFQNVKNSQIPVIGNLFSGQRKMEWILGQKPYDIGMKLRNLIRPPGESESMISRGLEMLRELSGLRPKIHTSLPSSTKVLDKVDLDRYPICTTWPKDGGPFITLPIVITKNPVTGQRNAGMYRLQKYDNETLGMHWQIHKGGSQNMQDSREKKEVMDVAVTIGSDPLTIFSAVAPLPDPFDEFSFSGLISGKRIDLVKGNSVDLEYPMNSEIVLEGYVDPSETRIEGPFGDHTGYYSLEEEFPVFHIKKIIEKKNPVYPTTIVGKLWHEDVAMGNQGTTALTNTTPVGAYRGAGRPEATQLIERVMDVAADQMGIDPADLRRKNFIAPSAFPLTTVTGGAYDSGEYAKALDAALAAADYPALRTEQERRRKAGERVQLGIGVSSYVEVTAPLGLHTEYGAVQIDDDGSATLFAGTSVHGQGHHTAFAMVASDVLGIPMESIKFVNSDTAAVPHGAGTMGSRSLQTAGNAVLVASEQVLERAKTIAAHMLEASRDDIVTGGGALHVAGVPGKVVSWAELAAASRDATRLPEGMEAAPLRHEGDFDGGGSTFPFGSHVSVVEVDTETGAARLVRYVAIDDCGTRVNPLIIDGQVHGGIAQGVGQALYEDAVFDEAGNLITGSFADYLVPSSVELPSFELGSTVTPSPSNLLGVKGVGEAGTIASTPAVVNAVVDALVHLGVDRIEMPASPQRIFQSIEEARR